jgi:hypothetical protein
MGAVTSLYSSLIAIIIVSMVQVNLTTLQNINLDKVDTLPSKYLALDDPVVYSY